MSYYYDYYIGYEKDGKLYPLGPYKENNKLTPALSRSRSFASDLHNSFYLVNENQVSDELRAEFEHECWDGDVRVDVKYLPINELPNGSFIRSGYFLIEEVKQYENSLKDEDFCFDGFSLPISPTVYVEMANNELKFGKPKKTKDEDGEWYTPYSASDYMFYMYPEYHCKEYEATVLRMFADALDSYEDFSLVILETEG